MPNSPAVCWIDHYVIPITDAERWLNFYGEVLGAAQKGYAGGPGARTQFTWVGKCHVGGSISPSLVPGKPLGVGTPRYTYYIRASEIDEHLRRLDEHHVSHLEPRLTDEEGEEGTVIPFEDPDGNQLEFWAPANMPEGGMDGETPVKVGRIAAAAFESRDLARTRDFYSEFLGLVPTPDVPQDTLAFPLAAGGRLVYKQTDELGTRTLGHTLYHTLHTALMVRDDEQVPILRHLWESLPEWDYDPRNTVRLSTEEAESRAPSTLIHGAPNGNAWKAAIGRGDNYCDWDTNVFHFVPAAPVDGSMAHPNDVDEYAIIEAEKLRRG